MRDKPGLLFQPLFDACLSHKSLPLAMLRDGSKGMHVYRLKDLDLTIGISHHTCHAFLDLRIEALSR